MIGIVILGLGMVMVATIFPVAWDRARTLNEYTVQQSAASTAHATVKSLLRVSSRTEGAPSDNASSFFGDWMYDTLNNRPVFACQDFLVDRWVHALNMENVQVVSRQFVPPRDPQEPQFEQGPWRLEAPEFDDIFVADISGQLGQSSFENSFFRAQVRFHERMHPPMRLRKNVDAGGVFVGEDAGWDDALSSRRFCWAVFHRLRARREYDPGDPAANVDLQAGARSFDMYYVTLRRPRSTHRYARQHPDPGPQGASVPNPCDLNPNTLPAAPVAKPSDEDVMFPVPWRVQVEFPDNLLANADATGIPTEIEIPPEGLEDAGSRNMLVQMFPAGARFIDEITGEVYQVIKRRITGGDADQGVLTLDREVFREDITLPENDPQCGLPCEGMPFLHRRRTVWVFPPPVASDQTTSPGPRTFEGSQPVVGIDVRTLTIVPSQ
jgi:hypothetical protein